MKRFFLWFYTMLFFLVFTCGEVISQDLFRDGKGERIQAWTDRTLYAAGEKILFSAKDYHTGTSLHKEFSRIFYCEMITSQGKKIAGGKYLLDSSTGHGCIEIPEETISGIYFLRFYTRFMRNASPNDYYYIILKVINPDKTEVLKGNTHPVISDQAEKRDIISQLKYSITILNEKKTFVAREEVKLRIEADSDTGHTSGVSFSVVPEFTLQNSMLPSLKNPDTIKTGIYLPETRGISLSGQLVEKETRKPVRDARVNLSIIGDRDILVIRTDSSGRFFFALPDYKGNKDIFICADEIQDFPTEILIDNDFCSRPVNLPSPPFQLNAEEMDVAYRLAVNAMVSSVFSQKIKDNDTIVEEKKTSFYGKPTSTLVFDKYIDLPTLEDYFTELPVIVKIRKEKGKKQFRFFSDNIEMSMFDPIVLVDWVPVNDIEKILIMSPKDIDRVELVEYPYIKGDITFGGIISFISKKNDFAGIDLPKSGTFVNYSFLEDCNDEIPPVQSSSNIPDARNTVYWDPVLQTNDDGIADVTFHAPDTPGIYRIILRGITDTGEEIFSEDIITVTDK